MISQFDPIVVHFNNLQRSIPAWWAGSQKCGYQPEHERQLKAASKFILGWHADNRLDTSQQFCSLFRAFNLRVPASKKKKIKSRLANCLAATFLAVSSTSGNRWGQFTNCLNVWYLKHSLRMKFSIWQITYLI